MKRFNKTFVSVLLCTVLSFSGFVNVFAASTMSPKIIINVIDKEGNSDSSYDGKEINLDLELINSINKNYTFRYEVGGNSANATLSETNKTFTIPVKVSNSSASINFYDLPKGENDFNYIFDFENGLDSNYEMKNIVTKTVGGASKSDTGNDGYIDFMLDENTTELKLISIKLINKNDAPASGDTLAPPPRDTQSTADKSSLAAPETVPPSEKEQKTDDSTQTTEASKTTETTETSKAPETNQTTAKAEDEIVYSNPFTEADTETQPAETQPTEAQPKETEEVLEVKDDFEKDLTGQIYVDTLDKYLFAEYDDLNDYYLIYDEDGIALGYSYDIEEPIDINYFDSGSGEKVNPGTYDLVKILPLFVVLIGGLYIVLKIKKEKYSLYK